MSRLRIYDDTRPESPLLDDPGRRGHRCRTAEDRRQGHRAVAPGASQEEVFAAYRADIDRLVAERGFKSVDVASIAPDNPNRAELQKFLDEHFHKEDEVRFFVAGSACSPCTWVTRSMRSSA